MEMQVNTNEIKCDNVLTSYSIRNIQKAKVERC